MGKHSLIERAQTGGPDGDLGSNEILISRDWTICVIDRSGVLLDPDGADRTESKRLAGKLQMIEYPDRTKLGPNGLIVTTKDRNVALPDGTVVKDSYLNAGRNR